MWRRVWGCVDDTNPDVDDPARGDVDEVDEVA